jgi:hypothetical protein
MPGSDAQMLLSLPLVTLIMISLVIPDIPKIHPFHQELFASAVIRSLIVKHSSQI